MARAIGWCCVSCGNLGIDIYKNHGIMFIPGGGRRYRELNCSGWYTGGGGGGTGGWTGEF